MFYITYTTTVSNSFLSTPYKAPSLELVTEEEARKVFNRLLLEEKDLFSIMLRDKDLPLHEPLMILNYSQISKIRIKFNRFKKSMNVLENI